MSLLKLLSLLSWLVQVMKDAAKAARINKKKDAKDEALETGDQREFEKAIGGSSDPVPPGKYDGMYERPRTKKD